MNRDENMEIGTWSICGTNDSKVMKILGSNEERKTGPCYLAYKKFHTTVIIWPKSNNSE